MQAGGWRLKPGHYEPDRVPPEVLRYAGTPDTLPVGSPGKVGLLELGFVRTGAGRTELAHRYQKTPLQIIRPLYYDRLRPDVPYTYLISTGGGLAQGDRHRTDLEFGPGTSAFVTTQSHTKVYRMDADYACAVANLDIGAGAFVEYLPDPLVPFAGSRLFQRTVVRLDESATLLAGETIYAGRLSRDERHEYDVLAADLEVRRPDGTLVALDRVRLVPQHRRAGGLAVLGGRDVLATLYVFTPLESAHHLGDHLHTALKAGFGDDIMFGVSALPGDTGVWLRILANDTTVVARAAMLAWGCVHELLTGHPAPVIRKV